jgi:predicted nucleotidyltransferase
LSHVIIKITGQNNRLVVEQRSQAIMLNPKQIKILQNYLQEQPDIAVVYLYGSQATGQATNKSDIDLAVLFNDKKSSASWGGRHVELSVELSRLLGREVEVQDLSLVNVSFRYRVLQEGKILYCEQEKQRVEFEMHCLNNYFDLQPLYQEYNAVLQEQARKGLI